MPKVLVIGSGGREHALGWSIAKSDDVSEVIYAPGNAGTAMEEKGRNVPIDCSKKENFGKVYDLISSENIDLTVVGPEAPLNRGLVNFLNSKEYFRVFGPTQEASALEADKFFSYDLMKELGISQAESVKCCSTEWAVKAIHKIADEKGVVIKTRGLAAGKGVSVCDSKKEALEEVLYHRKTYSAEVLIAERLFGEEFSVFGFSDGKTVVPIGMSVQDHKRLFDNDTGQNTGGMGAYCPAPVAPAEIVRYVANNIMTPVVRRMKEKGIEYKGFLYAGMIMTEDGPKVIEFNIRFGDPEAQPMMMMLKNSIYEPVSLALEGKLGQINPEFREGAACCVVMAMQGYPENYAKGVPILGLENEDLIKSPGTETKIFHAGTKHFNDSIVTDGGRVLGVTGYSAEGLADAKKLAYDSASRIRLQTGNFYCRTDIADKALRQTK